MAETMTYDPGTDTVTTENSLTPDEQESLKVGEEMEAQQEQLLAGKYKNAEELERAYVELQSKLGEKDTEAGESTRESELSIEGQKEGKEEKETSENLEDNYYLEDGKVNYESVNDAYGEKLGNLFKDSEIDPWSISKHFYDNEGTITEEMYTSLEGAGLSRSSIDAYLAGKAAQEGYGTEEIQDLSESDVSSIKSVVGGDAEYTKIIDWAADNLPKNDIESFDELISTGNIGAIKLAVNGMKAQYENANGYEGRLYSGKAPQTSSDVFRSQPELVAAMSDPRYDTDPAYRQDVMQKLDRSDLQF
jgi:hypothetical protein